MQCTRDGQLTSVTDTSKTTQLWFFGGRHWKCIHAWFLNSISFYEDFSLVNLIMCEGGTFIDYQECYFLMTIPYIIVLSISAPLSLNLNGFLHQTLWNLLFSLNPRRFISYLVTICRKFFKIYNFYCMINAF